MLTPKITSQTQIRRLSYKKLLTWYSGLVKPKSQSAPFRHIVQIGDPTLRTVSDSIPPDLVQSPEVKFLVNRMRNVFRNYDCVGLSAPQIGVSFRVIMFEFNEKHVNFYSPEERKSKDMTTAPFTVVINPELRITDFAKVVFTESCQSVRGFFADVPRYKGVELTGLNEEGKLLEIHARGWLARMIQHEMDHLDGKIYTDTMDRKTLSCSCWEAVNERGGKVELPFYKS